MNCERSQEEPHTRSHLTHSPIKNIDECSFKVKSLGLTIIIYPWIFSSCPKLHAFLQRALMHECVLRTNQPCFQGTVTGTCGYIAYRWHGGSYCTLFAVAAVFVNKQEQSSAFAGCASNIASNTEIAEFNVLVRCWFISPSAEPSKTKPTLFLLVHRSAPFY